MEGIDMINQESTKSIIAIKQYIEKNKQNVERHKANVLVYAERKDRGPATRFIFANVEKDIGQVIIEDLHTIYGGCTNIFTTQDSSFSFINGTLCIKTKNSFGSEISIDVT